MKTKDTLEDFHPPYTVKGKERCPVCSGAGFVTIEPVKPKDDGPTYADIQERWALDYNYGARDDE